MHKLHSDADFTFPKNCDYRIVQEIGAVSSGHALEKLKCLPPKQLIRFIDFSMNDKKYLEAHHKLIKKLWSAVDERFDDIQSLKLRRQVQSIIHNNRSHVETYLPKNFTIIHPEGEIKTNRLLMSLKGHYLTAMLGFCDKIDISKSHPQVSEALLSFLLEGKRPVLTDESAIKNFFDEARKLNLNELIDEIIFDYYELSINKNYTELIAEFTDYFFERFNDHFNYIQKNHLAPSGNQEAYRFLANVLTLFGTKRFLERFDFKETIFVFELFATQIERVRLSKFSDREIALLIPYLPTTLVELDLSGAALSKETVEAIVSRCPSLQRLILANAKKWNVEDPFETASTDWSGFLQLKNLKYLDVSSCSDIAPLLEDMLKENAEHLEVLRMADCHLNKVNWNEKSWKVWESSDTYEFLQDDFFAERCLMLIAQKGKKLKGLDLGGHQVSGDKLFMVFANGNLRVLSLANNEVLTSEDLQGLGLKFRKLRSLNLSGVKALDERNLKDLLKSLNQYNKRSKLRELNIKGLIKRNAMDVFDAIKAHCPNLERLIFDGNDGNLHLAMEGLCLACPRLRVLRAERDGSLLSRFIQNLIKENVIITELPQITDAKILKSVSERFIELETLNVKLDKVPKNFVRVLSGLPNLSNLNLEITNDFDPKVLRQIYENCPRLNKLSLSMDASNARTSNFSFISFEQKAVPFSKPIMKSLVLHLDRAAPLVSGNFSELILSTTQLANVKISVLHQDDDQFDFAVAQLSGCECLERLEFNGIEIDQKLLLRFLFKNPRLHDVKISKYIHMIRAPNGEPILQVSHYDPEQLAVGIKSTSERYPYFKIIGKLIKTKNS